MAKYFCNSLQIPYLNITTKLLFYTTLQYKGHIYTLQDLYSIQVFLTIVYVYLLETKYQSFEILIISVENFEHELSNFREYNYLIKSYYN